MALNLIRRLLKGAPLTAEEYDGNLDKIEAAVEGNTAGLSVVQGSLGNAATRNVGTTAGTVAAGDDSRFSGPRTPTAHKSTHATGGSDPLTPADIGAEVAGAAANAVSALQSSLGNAATRNVGTAAGTVAAGDDSRFSEPRTPTAHKSTHATGGSDPLTPGDIGAEAAGAAASAVSAHAAAADPHPNYVLEANLQFTGPALAGRTAGTGGLEALTLGTGLSIVNGVLTVEGGTGGTGADGASAYEIAVANGFVGTEAEWLASLQGADGSGLALQGSVATVGNLPATSTIGYGYIVEATGDLHVWNGSSWVNAGPIQGPPGADGADGLQGVDGASAYEVAVANGFVGTEAQWLASLVGPAGADGADGADGSGLALQGTVPTVGSLPSTSTVGYGYIVETTGDLHVWNGSTWVNAGPIQGPPGADGADGSPGADGASAYEVAVAAGFTGTEAQWLATLVGPAGADGASAYEVAVAAGFAGTEAQWLASLVGPAGADGASAYQIAVAGGFTGSEAEWLASLVGPAGADGASAYQVAVAAGFVGTETQWLATLVGPAGADGADGAPGADGADGAPGVGVPAGGTTGQFLRKVSGTDYDASWQTLTVSDVFVIACSDETSNLTAGTNKARFTMPYAGTLTAVKADVNTAPTGSTLVVDINEAGVSVLSTKLSIDAGETSSSTAATPAVISDSALANGAVIGIDIDQIGSTVAGAGLKVTLYVTRS